MSGTVNCDNSTEILQHLNDELNSLQEVNEFKKMVEIERKKYNKYKIVTDTLDDLRKSNSQQIENNLKSKLTNIMLSQNCKQLLEIEDKFSRSCQLFGIKFNEENLNYLESKQLKEALELSLSQKSRNVIEEFQRLTKTDINTILSNDSNSLEDEQQLLVELQTKLKTEQDLYLNNLLSLQKILEEFVDLRLKRSPEVIDKKIKEFEAISRINLLRTNILNEKVRVDIFNETKNSFNAYSELIKDIEKQQDECRNSIENLQDLKRKYKLVSCSQFNEILKSFVQYKNGIEKKKLLYDCIKH